MKEYTTNLTISHHGSVSQDCGRVDLPPPVPGVVPVGGQLVGGARGEVGGDLVPVPGGHHLREPQVVHVLPTQQHLSHSLQQRSDLSSGHG